MHCLQQLNHWPIQLYCKVFNFVSLTKFQQKVDFVMIMAKRSYSISSFKMDHNVIIFFLHIFYVFYPGFTTFLIYYVHDKSMIDLYILCPQCIIIIFFC